MRLYKFLGDTKGNPTHGTGAWDMPKHGEPGAWRSEKGPLALCESGTLHYCEPDQIVHWIGPVLVEVEVRGETLREANKCGALEMRILRVVTSWDVQIQRAFAVWCAYGTLLAQRAAGVEPHPTCWAAVAVAHRCAQGEQISASEFVQASRDAWASKWKKTDAATERYMSVAAAETSSSAATKLPAWVAASSAAAGAEWFAKQVRGVSIRAVQSRQILLFCGEVST